MGFAPFFGGVIVTHRFCPGTGKIFPPIGTGDGEGLQSGAGIGGSVIGAAVGAGDGLGVTDGAAAISATAKASAKARIVFMVEIIVAFLPLTSAIPCGRERRGRAWQRATHLVGEWLNASYGRCGRSQNGLGIRL